MRKIAAPVAAVLALLVSGCGSTTTPEAAPSSAASTTTTTTTSSSAPTSAASGRPANEDLFVSALRAKGFVNSSFDETLVLTQGELHCQSLADGMTRQRILDAAGLPGSPARQKSEAVFFAAIVSLCPEHAGKATS
jgi:hypothetical protein